MKGLLEQAAALTQVARENLTLAEELRSAHAAGATKFVGPLKAGARPPPAYVWVCSALLWARIRR